MSLSGFSGLRRLLGVAVLMLAGSIWQNATAETLSVAAGAGYKRLISELATAFEHSSGIRMEYHFGNLGQVLTQAVQSDQLSMILGDQSYLESNNRLKFSRFLPAGRGRLVIAWPTDKTLEKAEDLAEPAFQRIAIPDLRYAIYGKAGSEYLERSGLVAQLHANLLTVATVPQVSAYLVSGEVDAGFINLTEAIGIRNQIGGYLELDPGLYDEIRIVGGVIAGREKLAGVSEMAAFLETSEAKTILARHGL